MPSQHPDVHTSSKKTHKAHAEPSPSKGSASSSTTSHEDQQPGQVAVAGPSSPSRRRRRPSTSRRRSSSISAAASLISSYSKTRRDESGNEEGENSKRPDMKHQGKSDVAFAGGATEAFHDARQALSTGMPSPYHMAVVTLLGSLAQGMPLASMFKVYSYIMCRVYQDKQGSGLLVMLFALPPAPELPSDPICEDPWVQEATSTYAAAMATVGALLGLVLLERCSRISRRFGRKPLMLFTHLLLAIAFIFFRISVALPTYIAAAVLYAAVMVLEASAGAPLRIAVQNYVVDTTSEAQRAGALSFIDGFGQLGAFPSTTLGGLLAAATQQFFAPFYATVTIYTLTFFYILIFVPESKSNRHHTLIDNWEHGISDGDEDAEGVDGPEIGKDQGLPLANGRESERDDGSVEERMQRRVSYISTVASEQSVEEHNVILRLFHRFNFLAPLSVFLPKRIEGDEKGRRDWRLLNLAMIVIFEESYQVFLVPILLLYNTQVFKFDVVQNGYLVSLLQGTRAVFLTLIFPPTVSKARQWIGKRIQQRSLQQHQSGTEQEPLLSGSANHQDHPSSAPGGRRVEVRDMAAEEEDEAASASVDGQTKQNAKQEDRGKLDIFIMFVSYLISTFSFLLLCTSRAQQESKKNKVPAWVGIGVSIVGLQLGSGATSVRTALIVNAVGEEEEQSKALAANQILCTGVYALVPLVTSSIFGWGLQIGKPEIVWTFKAIMASLAAISTLVLFLSHRTKSSTHHSSHHA
ncbi:hypothetical protein CBS101457_000906 [Exobasidium rhododendri]|nr:hypothetical protein CBS101457_000906 [Exobasidium rhododendri]